MLHRNYSYSELQPVTSPNIAQRRNSSPPTIDGNYLIIALSSDIAQFGGEIIHSSYFNKWEHFHVIIKPTF